MGAEWIVATPLDLSVPDASDRAFLEVAVSGGADALVTGSKRHFHVREGTLALAVATPREFLALVAGR